MELKYGTWKISSYEPADARALCAAGFSPITAALLCSRGYRDAGAAREFLSCSYPLSSPFALLDMDKAAARVKQALSRREHIAVFGDYDVDGDLPADGVSAQQGRPCDQLYPGPP